MTSVTALDASEVASKYKDIQDAVAAEVKGTTLPLDSAVMKHNAAIQVPLKIISYSVKTGSRVGLIGFGLHVGIPTMVQPPLNGQ